MKKLIMCTNSGEFVHVFATINKGEQKSSKWTF